MGEDAVLLTILSGALAVVLGTATFFIQKWIALVDETLKEHNTVIYKVSSQVSSLESVQSRSSENITETLLSEGRNTRLAIAGLSKANDEIEKIKDVLQTRILPQIENKKDQLGKIIILEQEQKKQGEALSSLVGNLKTIIEKSSRPK